MKKMQLEDGSTVFYPEGRECAFCGKPFTLEKNDRTYRGKKIAICLSCEYSKRFLTIIDRIYYFRDTLVQNEGIESCIENINTEDYGHEERFMLRTANEFILQPDIFPSFKSFLKEKCDELEEMIDENIKYTEE